MTIESIGDITILAIPSQDGTSDEYNMSIQPDIYETNPDIIKAELSFYTTPHSADYGQAVYYTLKNIETTCAYDYTKFCSVPSTTVMSFEFIRSRALAHASPAGRSDTSMTRASRDVKRIMEGKRSMSHGMPIPIENNPESSINSRKSRRLRGKRRLREDREFYSTFGNSEKNRNKKHESDHFYNNVFISTY